MVIENKFNIKDVVYLITDEGQSQRIIDEIRITENIISYHLMCGTEGSWHYDFEISTEKSFTTSG